MEKSLILNTRNSNLKKFNLKCQLGFKIKLFKIIVFDLMIYNFGKKLIYNYHFFQIPQDGHASVVRTIVEPRTNFRDNFLMLIHLKKLDHFYN